MDVAQLVPDTKDWTWTLERRCPECRLVAGAVPAQDLCDELRQALAQWSGVALRPRARDRRDPRRWSDLEYACHVRDVCRVFADRLTLMLEQDDPAFEDWDQDDAAVRGRYAAAEPAIVASEVSEAAVRLVASWAGVEADQWGRTGVRSNGSRFTVLTLGQYCLHDLVHHGVDVTIEA